MHDEAGGMLPALLAKEQLDDVILVGHSDGASIALLFASVARALAPRVKLRGVVAIAPHVFVEPICVESIAKIRAQYEQHEADDLRERLAFYHGANVDNAFLGWSGAWLDPDFLRWNIEAELAAIEAPLLVAQGESDPYGTVAQVDAIARGVRAPIESLLLPGAGHAPHRERPREVVDAIARFVDRVAMRA
jgi:pimeloyl-ACP methyl ester carboxylesterase